MPFKKWIKVEDQVPEPDQVVILFANGVVQEETYMLGHESWGSKKPYWYQDDARFERLDVESGQQWQALPDAPNFERLREYFGKCIPPCPKCATRQVQLVKYIHVFPPGWKCRKCNHYFKF